MSLDEHEAETRRLTLTNHRDEAALLDRILDHFLRLDVLTGQKIESRAQSLILTLCVKSFNSLRCARDAVFKGYYAQALTLARATEEDWITCLYVHKYPSKAALWFKDSRLPRFADMWRALDDELSAKIEESYGVLSTFAHPRLRALLVSIDRQPGNVFLRLGGKYDSEHFTAAVYMMIVEAIRMLRVPSIYAYVVDTTWVDMMTQIEKDVVSWLKATNERLQGQDHADA